MYANQKLAFLFLFYSYFFSCVELVTIVQRLILPIFLIVTESEINPGRSLVLHLAVLALLNATPVAPLTSGSCC